MKTIFFSYRYFFHFLVRKTLDTDPETESLELLELDSKNESGSTTLERTKQK
jgi:hypothetical protein